MTRGLSPRALTAIWVGSLALSIAASTLSARVGGRPPEIFLPIGITTAVYATAGFLVARRRPENRLGYVLMAIGPIQAGLVVSRYLVVWTEAMNVAFSPIGVILVAFVLLSFPTGMLSGRAERVAWWAMAVTFLVLGVATVFTVEPTVHPTSRCPPPRSLMPRTSDSAPASRRVTRSAARLPTGIWKKASTGNTATRRTSICAWIATARTMS